MRCPKGITLSTDRLPGELENDHIERVYGIFKKEMEDLCTNYTYNGKKIVFPDYGVPDLYRAFFNHIIQYNGKGKPLNYARLVKSVLLPIMLKNMCNESTCPHIYKKIAKKKRMSIYCGKYSYVVLCDERKASFFIITGYYVRREQAIDKFC